MATDVEFRFYGPPRDAVGTKHLTRPVPESATVETLLQDLITDVPELEDYIFEDGALRRTAVVRKNHENVTLDDPVTDGDIISVTTQVVGG